MQHIGYALGMTIAVHITNGKALGWSFTPLTGKRPTLMRWPTLPRESVDDAVEWSVRGNVGLRTGAISGIAVIDIDAKSNATPKDFPRTVTVRTGGGGWHLYYRWRDGIGCSPKGMPPGVDVRGTGGQVVFVGSVHPTTKREYVWEDGLSPDDVAIAEFPASRTFSPQTRNIRSSSIRERIIRGMKANKLTRNALASLVSKSISRSQVYAFIDGDSDITTAKADVLLATVGQ
jgi:hypothetical protein